MSYKVYKPECGDTFSTSNVKGKKQIGSYLYIADNGYLTTDICDEPFAKIIEIDSLMTRIKRVINAIKSAWIKTYRVAVIK
jgi:hypothetical protein